jgi:hydrogenase maturation protease
LSDASRSGYAIIGIGNVLMGDEGVGVHAVRRVEAGATPPGVSCLDGGTGGLHLLDAMHSAERVILIDATCDGAPPGTIRRLRPTFSSDYPPTLTAHDIGLKDLLDAMHLLGNPPSVTLFTVSIAEVQPMSMEMSEAVAAAIPELVSVVLAEAQP